MRPNGYYWIELLEYGSIDAALYRDGMWRTEKPPFEREVRVIEGPFPHPTPEQIAGHSEHLARVAQQIWDESGADPRWDGTHVDGFYWVKRKRHKIELARFCENIWMTLDLGYDAKQWEVFPGKGERPTVLFGPLNRPDGWNRISRYVRQMMDEQIEQNRERLLTGKPIEPADIAMTPKPKLH